METILLLCVVCCGHDEQPIRQVATDRLEQAGPLAIGAALWGTLSDDPEVRARCRPILERYVPPIPKEEVDEGN